MAGYRQRTDDPSYLDEGTHRPSRGRAAQRRARRCRRLSTASWCTRRPCCTPSRGMDTAPARQPPAVCRTLMCHNTHLRVHLPMAGRARWEACACLCELSVMSALHECTSCGQRVTEPSDRGQARWAHSSFTQAAAPVSSRNSTHGSPSSSKGMSLSAASFCAPLPG